MFVVILIENHALKTRCYCIPEFGRLTLSNAYLFLFNTFSPSTAHILKKLLAVDASFA